jgi:SAM-dependent methyltransferase
VSEKAGQYARKAGRWSDAEYAAPDVYLDHRAELVASLGVELAPGDEVLDLACGDGGLGRHLLARGLAYRGVDVEPEMVDAARLQLGAAATVERGELDTYAPPEPVAATTVFRAIYYAHDRPAFFARARSYTSTKLVFDLNPRQYRVKDVVAELEAAGFARVVLRPFLVPQTRRLPRAAVRLVAWLERTPLARLALRARFTYLVAALVDPGPEDRSRG